MLRDEVLTLLKGAGDAPQSGEAMSRTLGVSRAAVWKAIEKLRNEGYAISSAPKRGYRLDTSPDRLSAGELAGLWGVVGRDLLYLDSVDSTNNELKRRAMGEAPTGLAVLADEQTGGRGRMGRTFTSPAGKGLYLSVLLRPDCPLATVSTLTAWTAVAVCRALEATCGIQPGIKWPNDVVLAGRKLCGILTELGLEGESGALQYVVVGVGVNVSQTVADFGPEVSPVAISLAQVMDCPPRRAVLAAALLGELDCMYAAFPHGRSDYLAQFRARCLTTGQQVRLVRGGGSTAVFAQEIDDNFSLLVRHGDNRYETVSSGEVSVRGLLGYTD